MKKFTTIVFGCQMNRADAERVEAVMRDMGYVKTEESDLRESDVAIVLACSIRQKAIDRVYGLKKKFDEMKDLRPFTTILTGCVLEHDKKRMAQFFDYLIDINEIHRLPEILEKQSGRPVKDYLSLRPVYSHTFQAYIPITAGCNQLCHYCVVPYTRGPEVYRDPDDILRECRELIQKGYKEITLLGQTVNSYRHQKCNFAELLEMIDRIDGDFWIRFVSSHPNFFYDQLIDVWKKSRHITPYLHLAVQSGDNTVLERMNRKYTVERFIDVVEKIRKAIPEIAVSTDVIVGFSGETREQFERTKELFRRISFDMAYIAQYSVRPGTVGAKIYKDDVPQAEKERREKELNAILEETALKKNTSYIGRVVKVLVEKHRKGFWLGKSATFKTVKFPPLEKEENLTGTFVPVRITNAMPWGLFGERVV